ncbi:MAG TPA: immunoglobulin domain-containing protein [Verrucomicrobiae bacterium]|nr:immunoglobulin domain-containing protein [Verrucomicrobiae bacterium]
MHNPPLPRKKATFPGFETFARDWFRRGCTALLAAGLASPLAAAEKVDVWTYHNDNGRTGQNLNETQLTLENVNANQFGKLFSVDVDGWIFSQPLRVNNVSVPGRGTHDLLFVATMHDSVYAFDANDNQGANASPIWHVNFLDPVKGIDTVPISFFGFSDPPELGITGTPVIDRDTGTLYVVAKTQTKAPGNIITYAQHLHALDIRTGAEKFGGPVEIHDTYAGTGTGSGGTGTLKFDPLYEFQRAGLLLLNGVVYVAFASQGDIGPYHGWVVGFDAQTLQVVKHYVDTPDAAQGGIWMAGGAPAADDEGNIFLITGDGSFTADSGGRDYGDCILKLGTQTEELTVTDYFAPFDADYLGQIDGDVGSGGVMLIPDSAGSPEHPHLAVGAGKEGTVFFVDRDDLGKFNPVDNSQIVKSIAKGVTCCLSTPAFFNNCVYYQAYNDYLKAFPVSNAVVADHPSMTSDLYVGFPGATPSISANGTNNAIVWFLQVDGFASRGPAILQAYNATNLNAHLYDSTMSGIRDQLSLAQKFAVPTIANGKVYAASAFRVTVFGLLGQPVISAQPASVNTLAGGGASLSVAATGNAPFRYQWQFNGEEIADATNSMLTLSGLTSAEAGSYTVVVSNAAGEATSQPAYVSVFSLDPEEGLTVAGSLGNNYRIDYTTALSATSQWLTVTNFTTGEGPFTLPDAISTHQPQAFYRLVLLPDGGAAPAARP